MKISKLIDLLESILEQHGDCDVCLFTEESASSIPVGGVIRAVDGSDILICDEDTMEVLS